MTEELTSGELKIAVATADGKTFVRFSGTSTLTHPKDVIGPMLKRTFDFCAEHANDLEMDFRQLSYFNSGTVSCIVDAIGQAQLRNVKTELIYAPDNRSQRICFKALAGVVEPGGGVTFVTKP
jgi:hypothetical protein